MDRAFELARRSDEDVCREPPLKTAENPAGQVDRPGSSRDDQQVDITVRPRRATGVGAEEDDPLGPELSRNPSRLDSDLSAIGVRLHGLLRRDDLTTTASPQVAVSHATRGPRAVSAASRP